jgi:hypothetical protein
MIRWEVRRNGITICHGSEKSMPNALQQKLLRRDGYKIYIDGKLHKEQEKQNGKKPEATDS